MRFGGSRAEMMFVSSGRIGIAEADTMIGEISAWIANDTFTMSQVCDRRTKM